MGIIKKQFLANSIFTYLGLFIGFVNYIVILPRYFSTEQIGLLRLLISIAAIYAQIAQWGVPSAIIRYFPIYKTQDKRHNGILSLMLLLGLIGCLLVTLCYILGYGPIKEYFAQKSSLFSKYYWLVIPMGISAALFNNFEAISAAFYRSVEANFLREVFLRLTLSFLAGFYIGHWITFEGVVGGVVISYVLAFLIIAWILLQQRKFIWIASFSGLSSGEINDILKFSAYCMLSGGVVLATFNIDSIMIGSMVGLSSLGVFSVYSNLAVIIAIPSRAFTKIAYPVLAEAWSRNDLPKLDKLYYKSSIIQTILSVGIFLALCLCNQSVFALLKKVEYYENWMIFIFLGLSNMINAAFGVNHYLINSSPKYQYDSYFNLLLLILTVITNLIFIRLYGAIGAAFATFLSMLILNILKWGFIKIAFGLQPFSRNHIYVFLIALVSFLCAFFIPSFSNPYLDSIIRTLIFSILYLLGVTYFKVDVDINLFLEKYLIRIISLKKA
ncbi:MAG: oligosaccharide flippase family protein [Bacteroidia bacterium]|nr:oligosaccharide flippase family protein [Bacteroidia bacterium]MDW8159307.1 oligosaccharide flippase family protein [Bacteroidia bacterium]